MTSRQQSPFSKLPSMSTIGIRFAIDTVTHPLEYSKFLIQIGHEPLPAYASRTIFGRPVMRLPSCFSYIKFIKDLDGWFGLYRGVVPKVLGRAIGAYAGTAAVDYFELNKNLDAMKDVVEMSEEEKITICRDTLWRDVVGRTVCIVASHPLLVISHRMMAEFVGGEETYTGIFASIVAVFKEQGIFGFYSGLIPRWIGEMIFLSASSIIIYYVNSYIVTDKEIKSFSTPIVQYIVNSMTYQFQVVSACMSVNNCGLAAGVPPHMPIYRTWWSCRQHLSLSDQLFRGSSPVLRLYKGSAPNVKMVSYT